MKTNFKFFYAGIAGLVVATGFSVTPAIAELSKVDEDRTSTDTETGYPPETGGFPRWYEDKSTSPNSPLRLDLCVDATNPLCLAAPPPNPDAEIAFPDNFPDEAFWWTAEALTTTRTGNAKALLVLATEAAFGNGDPFDGDQIVFNRTRIRILGGLTAGRWYRITYPYGTKDLQATQKDPRKPATINFTEDFGCGVSLTTICDFKSLLIAKGRGTVTNPIGKPWLRWDTGAPLGYVGDPNVDHRVIGSPIPVLTSVHPSGFQNFFKVELLTTTTPRTVVQGVAPIAYTDLFSVSGKISPPPTPTP